MTNTKTYYIQTIIFIVLFLSFESIQSQTSKAIHLDCILKQLNINKENCYNRLVIEQSLPYSPDKSLILVPLSKEEDVGLIIFDIYILIIDNNSGKILKKYYEKNAWYSDAVQLYSIKTDFAPYRLNSEIRAVGLRVQYEGSSKIFPYEREDISLFIEKDSTLLKILNNYTISNYSNYYSENCEGESLNEKKVIILSDTLENNFKNLIIKNNITRTKKTLINNDCFDKETKEMKTETLRFNNKEYK